MTTATTTKTSSSNTRNNRAAAASGPIRIPKSAVQAMPVVPDDNNSNTAAAAAAANAGMQNVNIASILNSTGPIVTAVLLKAGGTRKEGEKNAADDSFIEAVQVDTTPKKQMVAEILGGPFTFLGQYEDEGIVLMIRKDQDNHQEGDSDGTNKNGLERNQHPLQPPFQTSTVWGDILCLKVAPDDEDDTPEADDENADAAMQVTITPKPNDEFFLNYTKEEYVQFAARTDVVYTPPPDEEAAMDDDEEEEEENAIEGASSAKNPPKLVEKVDSSDEEEDDGDGDGDAPYEMEEQGDQEDNDEEEGDDDDEEGGFLELLMGQVLQRFEQENGRMPDATELKALESAITEKLGGMQ